MLHIKNVYKKRSCCWDAADRTAQLHGTAFMKSKIILWLLSYRYSEYIEKWT